MARTCMLREFGLQMSCRLSLVLHYMFCLLCFVFVFMLSLKPRPFVQSSFDNDAGRDDCRNRLARPNSQASVSMVAPPCQQRFQNRFRAFSQSFFLLLIPPVLSKHAHFISIVGVGKRGVIHGDLPRSKAALVRNYLEVYWPCAGGLSAVNAIGTQLRDPINSGLTRWRMVVFI